jgi:hypothetical protein
MSARTTVLTLATCGLIVAAQAGAQMRPRGHHRGGPGLRAAGDTLRARAVPDSALCQARMGGWAPDSLRAHGWGALDSLGLHARVDADTAGWAMGMERRGPRGRGGPKMDPGGGEPWQGLGLTTDQQTQLQAIAKSERATVDSLRALVRAGTLAVADAQAQIQAARQAGREAAQAVLTPAQVQQLEEQRAAQQARMNPLRAQVKAGSLTRTEAEAQEKAARDAHQAGLAAILTADQAATDGTAQPTAVESRSWGQIKAEQ